ncbi:MAG: 7-cyano-7-deazaguanine synthase QueC [Chloroflexi bacterium]|nr:7-cyano-7-deazaguanine synthase QueC [Chloroflexota bacterium]
MSQVIAIVSGGLDSVTLAHYYHAAGHRLHLLAFDYGQRHKKELDFARRCARRLEARIDVVDLSGVSALLKGSALTDDIPVPEGHYAAPSMAVTVVPNRNAIMLSVAYGVAVAQQADIVAAGFHAGDHPIYPDCTPAFVKAFDSMAQVANQGYALAGLHLEAPFVNITKHEIVAIGARLGVPFAETWSCYKGLARHCGKCGTCTERREAFQLAGVADPTEYEEGSASPCG